MTSSEARTALTPMWVVVGLAMGPAVALGLARFAYALLLPAMRADLGWNFAEAGAMNAANAAGYLAGALVAALTARWAGDTLLFAVSLLLTAITVAASGLTADFALLLASVWRRDSWELLCSYREQDLSPLPRRRRRRPAR